MHPLDSMECPGCGATLPQTATGCACGYRFVLPNAPSTPPPGVLGGGTFAGGPTTSMSSMGATGSASSSDGTFAGGLALGLICGCVGLAIAHLARTGARTKQGALVGFGVGLVIGAFLKLTAIADR